jgi:hypothetical protein
VRTLNNRCEDLDTCQDNQYEVDYDQITATDECSGDSRGAFSPSHNRRVRCRVLHTELCRPPASCECRITSCSLQCTTRVTETAAASQDATPRPSKCSLPGPIPGRGKIATSEIGSANAPTHTTSRNFLPRCLSSPTNGPASSTTVETAVPAAAKRPTHAFSAKSARSASTKPSGAPTPGSTWCV